MERLWWAFFTAGDTISYVTKALNVYVISLLIQKITGKGVCFYHFFATKSILVYARSEYFKLFVGMLTLCGHYDIVSTYFSIK